MAVANDKPRSAVAGAGEVVVLLGEAQVSGMAASAIVRKFFIGVWQRCI